MIEIYHANKLLQLFDGCWLWKLSNSLHFLRQWNNSCRNAVAKEISSGSTKLAFVDIDHQAILLKALKELAQVA